MTIKQSEKINKVGFLGGNFYILTEDSLASAYRSEFDLQGMIDKTVELSWYRFQNKTKEFRVKGCNGEEHIYKATNEEELNNILKLEAFAYKDKLRRVANILDYEYYGLKFFSNVDFDKEYKNVYELQQLVPVEELEKYVDIIESRMYAKCLNDIDRFEEDFNYYKYDDDPNSRFASLFLNCNYEWMQSQKGEKRDWKAYIQDVFKKAIDEGVFYYGFNRYKHSLDNFIEKFKEANRNCNYVEREINRSNRIDYRVPFSTSNKYRNLDEFVECLKEAIASDGVLRRGEMSRMFSDNWTEFEKKYPGLREHYFAPSNSSRYSTSTSHNYNEYDYENENEEEEDDDDDYSSSYSNSRDNSDDYDWDDDDDDERSGISPLMAYVAIKGVRDGNDDYDY